MTQRALVTGATGLLGRQVVQAFEAAGWEVIGTGFNRACPPKVLKVDIQDPDEIENLFTKIQPRVVVHCAADRQPDSCTNNAEGARKLNVFATENVAKAVSRSNGFLIYISTDYVFPGIAGQAPYKASDTPNPTNVYGQTKLDGERAVLQTVGSAANGVILRVPVLYGKTEPSDNYKESAVNVLMDVLYKSQKEEGVIKMDDYAIRYPTNTEDVARVCVDITKYYTTATTQHDHDDGHDQTEWKKTKTKTTNLPQILQFSSEDKMTKYSICSKFSEIMALPLDKIEADRESGKNPGPDGTLRPYDCHLDTGDLKNLGIDLATVDFVTWWRREVRAFRH